MSYSGSDDASGVQIFKILVLGMNNAGKTCIIRQYVHKLFQPNIRPTIGVDFALKVVQREGRSITLQMWDIAGQEHCGTMTRVYYQQAAGALIVYDATDPQSFAGVQQWKEDVDYKVTLPDGRPIPCVLVANKCDLPENPPRSDESLNDYAAANDFVGWVRTSARENIRIDNAFNLLIDKIIERRAPGVEQAADPPVAVPTVLPAQSQRRRCCKS